MEENLRFYSYIGEKFQLKQQDIRTYSPLALAYIGDGVYELIIRSILVGKGNCPVNKLHRKSSSLVKASAQAELIHNIMEDLTEEEKTIYKRGRNAKSYTTAKNATMIDYRTATGLEALVGYLYLTEQMDRLLILIKTGLSRMGEETWNTKSLQ